MRQHLGQTQNPYTITGTVNPRDAFESSLPYLKKALDGAKNEAEVQAVFVSYQQTVFSPLENVGLWPTVEDAETDMARVYALVTARQAAVNGFLGLPTTTWLLIGAGAAAGWYFWKRSKSGM